MHRGHRCCGRHVSLGINCVDPCNNTLPYSIGGQSALRSFTHRAEPGLPPFDRPREGHVGKLQATSGRQVTFSSDLIYDVLRKYQPDHILLRATRQDAAGGLTDIRRLADMLVRVQGRIFHQQLDRISPLAVPAILEIGREQVAGGGLDDMLDEAAEAVIAEAMSAEPPAKSGRPGGRDAKERRKRPFRNHQGELPL